MMSGLFITAGICGYSFIAAAFNSIIKSTFTFSFFAGRVSDSDELLTSSACHSSGVGFVVETLAPTLVFDALVEACNTERRSRFTFPVASGGMLDCARSSNDRFLLGLLAVCVLEGTFTAAFFVDFLPFFVALNFSAGSSSIELVVKLQLELDGVGAFLFSAFAGCLFLAAFARLASSLSSFANCRILSISFP